MLRCTGTSVLSVKSNMVYSAQALFFLSLTTLKNIYVACASAKASATADGYDHIFMPCQEQKSLRLNRNTTLDSTLVCCFSHRITFRK